MHCCSHISYPKTSDKTEQKKLSYDKPQHAMALQTYKTRPSRYVCTPKLVVLRQMLWA